MGSGCGTVGRAVPDNTKEAGFESSHRQLWLRIYLLWTFNRKYRNRKWDTGNGPYLKTKTMAQTFLHLWEYLMTSQVLA